MCYLASTPPGRFGMPDLVFEVGTEELPASYVDIGLSSLFNVLFGLLTKEGVELPKEKVSLYGTPRRLTILLRDIPEKTEVKYEVVKGPPKKVAFDKDGNPTKALTSFLEKNGASIEDVVDVETERGSYVGVRKKTGGKDVKEVLSKILPLSVRGVTFPKNMRWNSEGISFGRPIRWIMAVFGDSVVEFELTPSLRSSRKTKGHRFLGSQDIEVGSPCDYPELLRKNSVEPEKERRKSIIKGFLDSLKDKDLSWIEDDDLLDEVSNLVEFPYPVVGSFHERFLDLPEEVVINVLKVHQKFFSFRKGDRLSNTFVGVSNNKPSGDEIKKGYERVVEARLNDALFFMEEDLKLPFDRARLEKLKEILFHKDLGSMYDKTMRLVELSLFISRELPLGDEEKVKRASTISKMDLTTHMVFEFPELQGVMGREYAKRLGEDEEVFLALFEQYLPRFAGDDIPKTDVGTVISLADKMDNLTGLFGAGEEPTSGADPHGLRRSALGIVYIVLGRGLRFNLRKFLEKSASLYNNLKLSRDELVDRVFSFIKGRMQNYFLNTVGYKRDAVNAVFSLEFDDLYSYYLRMKALGEERERDDFMDVFIPFKRVVNITRDHAGGEVDPSLFEKEEEKELFDAYVRAKERFYDLLSSENFEGILSLFRDIKPYVDRFFDEVFVMVEDERIRNNRLNLLKKISEMFESVADFSKFSL